MKPSINRSQVSSTEANYLKDRNDRVCIEMKGRLFSIPRHDYDRLIVEQVTPFVFTSGTTVKNVTLCYAIHRQTINRKTGFG